MHGPEGLLCEAERQFAICNACRYCEGYCAVFTAMERRALFTEGDVGYLANLCHDCRGCFQACMYAEPHELAINIPALMSQARADSYERYAWPSWFVGAFRRGPGVVGVLTLASLVVMIVVYETFASLGSLVHVYHGRGTFYEVVSHTAMVVPALLLTALAFAVAGLGFATFWRHSGGELRTLLDPRIWWTALWEAAVLRWLRGGGGDCFYPDEERASPIRRRLHHLVAYGFGSTCVATVSAWVIETFLHELPPYGIVSVPVLFGTIGGVAMVAGCLGLLGAKMRASRQLTAERGVAIDVAFLLSLTAVAGTGLLLLGLRGSSAMGLLLLVHLGTIAALYLTAPYGKFMHAVYRFGALLRCAQEQQLERASSPL